MKKEMQKSCPKDLLHWSCNQMVSLIIYLEHNQADKHTDIGSMIAQACLHVEFLKLIYFWGTIKRCLGTSAICYETTWL